LPFSTGKQDTEESRTSVFWYAVFLKVEDIVEEGDQLFSSYSIRLPSRSKDDEDGKVTFKLEKPLREIMTQGGKVQGVGISTNPKHPHREILCEFRPDSKKTGNGRVRMTIDTKERVLRFDSIYRATATESN
jgi:hypothetical protein